MTVTVELVGLEVFGRHGVDDDEREQGRTFLYDVALEVAAPASDRLEDTVDSRRSSVGSSTVSSTS